MEAAILSEGATAPIKEPSWRKPPGRRGQLPEGEQRLVGVDGAARMLGISPNSAYRLIREGGLPVVDLGKRTLVSVADIDALIERRRRVGTVKAAPAIAAA